MVQSVESHGEIGTVRTRTSGVFFRRLNDELAAHYELAKASRPLNPSVSLFVCECDNKHCAEVIEISPGRYRELRSNPASYLAAPGHRLSGAQTVIERFARFEVLEASEASVSSEGISQNGKPNWAPIASPAGVGASSRQPWILVAD